LERNAAVGYMVIRNIGDLLPKSFDAKIRLDIQLSNLKCVSDECYQSHMLYYLYGLAVITIYDDDNY
jgi:hypothetical protein